MGFYSNICTVKVDIDRYTKIDPHESGLFIRALIISVLDRNPRTNNESTIN